MKNMPLKIDPRFCGNDRAETAPSIRSSRRRRTGPGPEASLRMTGMVFIFGLALMLFSAPAFGNNVSVANVVLKDATYSTVEVEFDLAQSNSFGDLTDGNSVTFTDYIWVFIKYDTNASAEETNGWKHATLTSTGSSAAFSVTGDGKGAFIKAYDAAAALKLVWDYSADGLTSADVATVKVMAIEMVYIPQGTFIYNAAGLADNSANNYGAGSQVTVNGTNDIPTGAAAGWPNGYSAFYVMKHEVSQGQYADYLNVIPAADGQARWPGNYNSYRQEVSETLGNAYGSRYAAGSPNLGQGFTSWDDTKAYLSWCGLRPLTEMEYEKVSRGAGSANTNVYPWGSSTPSSSTYTYDGALIKGYFAWWGQDSNGPTEIGHYVSGDLIRSQEQKGTSPYGVTDTSGNLLEHVINCADTTVPANGDGTVTPPASWPSAVSGKGFRGGSWFDYGDSGAYLKVSDRSIAASTAATRSGDYGIRGGRSL